MPGKDQSEHSPSQSIAPSARLTQTSVRIGIGRIMDRFRVLSIKCALAIILLQRIIR
ncbi:MAG: hypothetical protein V1701_11595 [Planctomycetota bacterium]